MKLVLFMMVSMVACIACDAQVVAFKDAGKIKSWDAWDDHKGPPVKKEMPCVTWRWIAVLNASVFSRPVHPARLLARNGL